MCKQASCITQKEKQIQIENIATVTTFVLILKVAYFHQNFSSYHSRIHNRRMFIFSGAWSPRLHTKVSSSNNLGVYNPCCLQSQAFIHHSSYLVLMSPLRGVSSVYQYKWYQDYNGGYFIVQSWRTLKTKPNARLL